MTKAEALAKLESYARRADILSGIEREVAHACYMGELHRLKADVYRIAIAVVRSIEEEEAE